MPSAKTNTGHRDREGRIVWSGPRGGWFVEHRGRKIRVSRTAVVVPQQPLPHLPPEIVGLIAASHPRAAARLAVSGQRNAVPVARRHAVLARHVGRAWRAKTGDLVHVRRIIAEIRNITMTDPATVRAVLTAAGFKRPWHSRPSEGYIMHVSKTYPRGYVASIRANNVVAVLEIEKRVASGGWILGFEVNLINGSRHVGGSPNLPYDVWQYAEKVSPVVLG